ncbi:alpha/beta hydrolase [Maricaulis sp.]|uniref:alpha/beta fold hydrolase n=1 Tax=Maricaulis sp. TaxID=1486257 RepID=UPI002B2729FF|nr:alpha/beta hydrolase [Maricaulis sp.]
MPPFLPILGIAAVILLGLVGLAAWQARRAVTRIETRFPPRAEFITVDGTRLHVRQTGPATGPAILVLHGAASNLEEPHLALSGALADERVIWLDRPGLGWSDRPAGDWNPEREATLIARLLDTLATGPVTVIGHSWGGAITLRLAMDHPGHVAGIVLVAPALSAWIGDAAWFNAASFWPVLGPLITRLIVPLTGEGQAGSGAARAFHPEPMPDGYVDASALPLLLRPGNWQANSIDMKQVNLHLETQEDRYEDISQPTVILAGRADTVLWSHRHGGMVAQRMPRATMRWIPGAGHNLHHHHPATVLEAVIDVRSQVAQTAPNAAMTGPAA